MFPSSCMVLNNALTCSCPPPFTGVTCEQTTGTLIIWDRLTFGKIKCFSHFIEGNPICSLIPDICKNGGTWVKGLVEAKGTDGTWQSFRCIPVGSDSWNCNCPSGYTGPNCETTTLSRKHYWEILSNHFCYLIGSKLLFKWFVVLQWWIVSRTDFRWSWTKNKMIFLVVFSLVTLISVRVLLVTVVNTVKMLLLLTTVTTLGLVHLFLNQFTIIFSL